MDNPFLATDDEPGNVVLDIDGVIFLGGEVIPGAGRALTAFADRGWRVLFATNNGTREVGEIVGRIASQTGFDPDPDLVVTSGLAAAGMVGEEDQPVFVVGERGLHATLEAAGVAVTSEAAEARCVLVALDRGFTYDRLAAASTAIRDGARFIATNTDRTFPTPAGQVPGAGSLVVAVAAAAGREPEVAGKPHQPMVEAVRRRLRPGATWMVGDRPETDLAFGRAGGWRTILTLSGVTGDGGEVSPELAPDLIVGSIADLAQ